MSASVDESLWSDSERATYRSPALIAHVIDAGIVPRAVELLKSASSGDELLHEAAWLLSNVVYGDEAQTRHVVDAGGLDALVGLIDLLSESRD